MQAQMSPTGKARGTSMFFGGIRRSIPSYAQGFGGLSSSHSSTAIGRGLLRRRIKGNILGPYRSLAVKELSGGLKHNKPLYSTHFI